MEKASKILVPTDFSPCSENALVFAMRLADKIKAIIQVINVPAIDSDHSGNPMIVLSAVEEQMKSLRKKMVQSVEQATEKARPYLSEKPQIESNVQMGKIDETICGEAKRNQVDYIIMGTQGENSTLDKYLGSTASNVLKKAHCPVIVIPEHAAFPDQVTIGYATDFAAADAFEIWRATQLLQHFQPELKCVHFNEDQVLNLDKVQEFETYFAKTSPELNMKFYSLPVKDKVKDMNEFIEKEAINMLVMFRPRRSFLESLFHQSYTQKMALHVKIPLLIMKEE